MKDEVRLYFNKCMNDELTNANNKAGHSCTTDRIAGVLLRFYTNICLLIRPIAGCIYHQLLIGLGDTLWVHWFCCRIPFSLFLNNNNVLNAVVFVY